MRKKELLSHWEAIKPNQEIKPAVVPYKHEGSTFDQDGIRLTGSQKFIDSVLSHLKPLLQHENGTTRLQVSHSQATDRHTGAKLDSFKCYIQVHQRGRQAQICNTIMGRC